MQKQKFPHRSNWYEPQRKILSAQVLIGAKVESRNIKSCLQLKTFFFFFNVERLTEVHITIILYEYKLIVNQTKPKKKSYFCDICVVFCFFVYIFCVVSVQNASSNLR